MRLEGTYLSTLRSRFLGEQKGEAEYRAAAGRTEDPCLRELYLELAEDENAHGWMLRGMLEKMVKPCPLATLGVAAGTVLGAHFFRR